jgi:hypothetical protein
MLSPLANNGGLRGLQNGSTVLHCAAKEGHIEILKLLFDCERFTEANAKDMVAT